MRKILKHAVMQRLLLLLIIVALAAAVEFGYAASGKTDLEYRRVAYSAADFDSWEIEAKGDDSYYMLANNSYFLIENLGGGAVQTVDVYLTRDSGDPTETVLYFAGTLDGVTGEFPVAMRKTSDGVYTAALDAEAVHAIRIHPTQTVRSTLEFSGITVNPSVAAVSYSAARIILWGFLIASLYVMYKLIAFFIIKQRNKAKAKSVRAKSGISPWVSAYILLGAAALLGAFQASNMFTALRGAEHILLPVVFAGFSLLYLALWWIVKRIQKVETKLFAVVLLVGILFSFANAPLQAPDEYTHFLRAYTVSRGQLAFDYHYVFPDDVYNLIHAFPAEMNNEINDRDHAGVPASIQQYLSDPDAPVSGRAATSLQLIVPYIPAAIGITITRLLGANALVSLYAARVCNVLVLALCAYCALKWAARYRGALIAMILMPLTLFMGASTSYDSMFLSCIILLFGLIGKEEFTNRDLLVAMLLFGAILSIKNFVYLPLVLLLLLIPKSCYRTKLPRPLCMLLVAAGGLLVYGGTMLYASLFARGISPEIPLAGVDVSAQIQYVLTNPVRYLLVLAVDAYSKVFYLPQFGLFGWLDVNAAVTGFLTPIVLVAVGALYADASRFYKKKDKWVHAAVAVLVYAVVITGFYATWSTLGSTTILGVQARYFIPIVPCLVSLISKVFSPVLRFRKSAKHREDLRDVLCVYMCGGAAFIGAAELALNYFLM